VKRHDNKVYFEDCRAIAQSVLGVLVHIDGVDRWVPQSQIDDDSEIWRNGDEGTLVVSRWWAEKAGLV